jgi:hypothetical protein
MGYTSGRSMAGRRRRRWLAAAVAACGLAAVPFVAVGLAGCGDTPAEDVRDQRKLEVTRALRPLHAGQQRMLYLTQFGHRVQLRMRAFPFPGEEGVLWESPESYAGVAAYQPSPSFSRVAVIWRSAWRNSSGRPRVFVVPVSGGEAYEVRGGADFAWWQDDHTLILLTEDGVEVSYDVVRRTGTEARDGVNVLDRLTSGHAEAIATLDALARAGKLPFRLREGEARVAVLLGAGFPPWGSLHNPAWTLPSAVAALSPDGRYLALAKANGLCICSLQGSGGEVTGCTVLGTVKLQELVDGGGVRADDLRWSADSKHLTFTEEHHHPAASHPPDMGYWYPDPVDWTDLVRMYSLTPEGGKLTTIAAGRSAFLMPPSWQP